MSASRNIHRLHVELPAPLPVYTDSNQQQNQGHHDHIDTPYPTLQLFIPEAIGTSSDDGSTSKSASLKFDRYRHKSSQSGLYTLVDVLNPLRYPQQAQTYVDDLRHKRQLQKIKKDAASSCSDTPIPEYVLDTVTDPFATTADEEATEPAHVGIPLQLGKSL